MQKSTPIALEEITLERELPYMTPQLEGCGGRLKSQPEDFQVEEIPLYPPSGSGEHLLICVEKTSKSTDQVIAHFSKILRVSKGIIGAAGKKDTQAVTRQWISIQTPENPEPVTLETEGIRVLSINRHSNKLRKGHLWGNSFRIAIRDIDPAAPIAAVLREISFRGFPNYFGAQRFGPGFSNALAGRAILRRERTMKGAPERIKFLVNAYQSALFNQVVALRLINIPAWETPLEGDILVLHRNGASFEAAKEDLPVLINRAGDQELSPSAPLPGYHNPWAAGLPGQWEEEILRREGLLPESFRMGSKRVSPKGERRPVREFAHDLCWEILEKDNASTLILNFKLRKGVYGTTLVREIIKGEGAFLLNSPLPESKTN